MYYHLQVGRRPAARLGRSTRDVLNLMHERDTRLFVLDTSLTSDGETGRIIVTVLGIVAELERTFILERQRAGIERAGDLPGRGGARRRRRGSAYSRELRVTVGSVDHTYAC